MTAHAAALTHHFRLFHAQTLERVSGLTDEELWTKPYPYGNSVGHLLLHVTGNLNYYIGTQIAGTAYVRDRDREFTDSAQRPKADVLADLDRAVTMVVATIAAQSTSDWEQSYEAVRTDETTRAGIVIRCAGHFHHHLGQIIYLVKEHERRRR